jgi:predicted nucleic acid-binding protein
VSERIALDTGPLGQVVHPKATKAAAEWFLSMLESDCEVLLPEIADYELRRNLILEDLTESIQRLDLIQEELTYLPIKTETMLLAANLWAEARRRGKGTAGPKELDGDAILAAQARLAGAIVATDNVIHLNQFVETRRWRDMRFSGNRTT